MKLQYRHGEISSTKLPDARHGVTPGLLSERSVLVARIRNGALPRKIGEGWPLNKRGKADAFALAEETRDNFDRG